MLHTVLLGIIFVLSSFGNLLVSLAFYKNRRLRSITNFYVLSLAVADLTVAIFAFPSVIVASGLQDMTFSDGSCQFSGFATSYLFMVSLCILALTSINRYFCVVKPQRYSYFFNRKKTILFGYIRVYSVVWQHNNVVVLFVQETNIQGVPRAREIKTSRVLLVTVIGFCVSWIPNIVVTSVEFGFGMIIPFGFQSTPMVFACVSAWINPIIYGVMNRAMQREFQNILLCGKDGRISRQIRGASFFVRAIDNRRTLNENVLTVTSL